MTLHHHLMTTPDVEVMIKEAKEQGVSVSEDSEMVVATLEGETVFRGIQKGHGGAWIVYCNPNFFVHDEVS